MDLEIRVTDREPEMAIKVSISDHLFDDKENLYQNVMPLLGRKVLDAVITEVLPVTTRKSPTAE